jgi:hypothetical protein
MSCGGGHLEFSIGIKKQKLFENSKWPPPQEKINIGPYGKMFKCLLLRNYKYY